MDDETKGHVPVLLIKGEKYSWDCSCGTVSRKWYTTTERVRYLWRKHALRRTQPHREPIVGGANRPTERRLAAYAARSREANPERHKEWRNKIRETRTRDTKNREKLCQFCGVFFCPIKYRNGRVYPSPDKTSCAEAHCKQAAQVYGTQMSKNYGTHSNQYTRRNER